jgi:DNA polymerase (family 10)
MKNRDLALIFNRLADALEFKDENPFKITAYRKAARIIENLSEDIENIWKNNRLREIPGIGEGIAKKISQYLTSGKIDKYEEVMRDIPEGIIPMLSIPNLGPKTLQLAYKELKVTSLEELQRVIEDGSLAQLFSMGEKKVENIKKGIKRYLESSSRILLGVAYPVVERIIEYLRQQLNIELITSCGSLRRMRETIGDLDILTSATNNLEVIRAFTNMPNIREVLVAGTTKASIITEEGLQVDLRVVDRSSYGSALQYFTGSKAHNIRLREKAKKFSPPMKISEYGVFIGDKKIGGKEEEEIYEALNLSWIPPYLREDSGEIEAAEEGRLPHLVSMEDIKGDLHVHSRWSDGTATLEEILERASQLNYEYVLIADHSQSVKYAGGLSEDELKRQIETIHKLNQMNKKTKLLAGIEVDIKKDGSLDYKDELLAQLDLVIAAIHTGFKQNVTERLCSAMENPHVDIIAHPTGRLISSREGYELNIDKILEKAAETHTLLEINAYYDRLDLPDIYCRRAKDMGIMLAIGTDAHHLDQLWMMQLGVGVAQRGWLSPENVLNTYSYEEIINFKKNR